MKNILRDELERILTYLAPQKGNYLQDQAWDSLVYSGNSFLLEPQLQRELFRIYDLIKNLNIDVKREEAAEQVYLTHPNDKDKKKVHDDLDLRNRKKESGQ